MLIVLLVVAAIALVEPGSSTEHDRLAHPAKCRVYASPGGSDRWAGTRRRPYRTVRRLLRAVRPGKAGCLRSGTYRGNVTFRRPGRRGRPITLQAAPRARARLLGRVWVARKARHVTVRGLRLDGRNRKDLPSPTINGCDARFLYNDVTNRHTAICFLLGSDEYGRANRALVARNRIHDCGVLPADGHDHGIYAEAVTGATIEDNWIYDNADYGIHFYPDAQSTTVRRNVIYGNGMGVIFAGVGGRASSGNLVEGNVIAASKRGHNVDSYWPPGGPVGSGNLVRRNCLFGGPDPESGGVVMPMEGFEAAENLVADPAPVDPAGKRFEPAPGSPCRGVVGDSAGDPGSR